jgi:hypothetical protein
MIFFLALGFLGGFAAAWLMYVPLRVTQRPIRKAELRRYRSLRRKAHDRVSEFERAYPWGGPEDAA